MVAPVTAIMSVAMFVAAPSDDLEAPSTVYLRVCDRVADKKDLAKKWAEALTTGAAKQQPLGNRYDGEDVSTKNPFQKALARVQSHAGRPAS